MTELEKFKKIYADLQKLITFFQQNRPYSCNRLKFHLDQYERAIMDFQTKEINPAHVLGRDVWEIRLSEIEANEIAAAASADFQRYSKRFQ